ncbi:MAG: hypothetical protein ACON3Z_09945 [Bradymonadia bacterium]
MRWRVVVLFAAIFWAGCIESRSSAKDPSEDTDTGTIDMATTQADGGGAADLGLDGDAETTGVCETTDDCEAGAQCVEGQCTEPECRGDDQCANVVQGCVEGVCRDRCLGPGTCIRGGECQDGFCLPPECESDDQCDGEQYCRSGNCVELTACASSEECTEDERCTDGLCEALPACVGDRECPEDSVCQNGLCRPRASCGGEDDCAANEDCIGGRCVPAICRGSVDCEDGLACRDGICVEEEAQEVETLIITGYPRILRVDADPVQVSAVALDVRGDVIPITSTRFVWIVDNEEVAAIDASGRLQGLAVGTINLTVRYDLANGGTVESAAVAVRVIESDAADAMPGVVRVNIVDAEDGRAIGGATVRYGMQEVVADETGIVTFEQDDAAPSITVFSRDHDYLTLVGAFDGSYVAPLRRKSSNERVAGISGTVDFDAIMTEGGVDLSLSGPSVGQGMSDLSFGSLLGAPFNVPINAGPAAFDIPIPSGVTLAADLPIIGRIEAKSEFYGTTEPGIRLAWSLAGRMDVGRLIQLAQGGDGNTIGRVLGALLPYFETFQHGFRVGERLVALPRVADENDLDGDGDRMELRPDYERFPVLNIRPNQLQDLRLALDVGGIFVPEELLIVFSGVSLPGIGFVPLGVTAANEDGEYPGRMAAPYGGLEQGVPTFLAMSARFGDAQALPESLTIHIQRAFGGRVPNDVVFEAAPVSRPTEAAWNAVMRSFDGEGAVGADAHRVVLAGPDGRWDIYFEPGGETNITLPFPPEGYADLAAGPEQRFEALQFRSDADIDYEGLIRLNGAGLDTIDQVLRTIARRAL